MTHEDIHERLDGAETIDEKLDAIEIAAEYGFGHCAMPMLGELTEGVKRGDVPATEGHTQRLTALAERFADLVAELDDGPPPQSFPELLQRISAAADGEQQALRDVRVLAEAAAIEGDTARRTRALRAARHAAQQAREAAGQQRTIGEAEAKKLEDEADRIAALVAQ